MAHGDPDVFHTYGFMAVKDWSTGQWSDLPVKDPTFTYQPPTLNDLYFTPCLFSEPRRLRKNALPGRWLYADLDEIDPRTLDPSPTIAWRTSPGRYQAMWLLDRPVSSRRLEDLNRALTYYTGADKGGWSLTKVLRIPGSISTKYGTDHHVEFLPRTHEPIIHSAADMARLLKDVEPEPTVNIPKHTLAVRDLPTYQAVYRRYRKRIPVRARQLLNTRTVIAQDDRSAKLWELENLLLHEAKLPPEEVFVLARHSPWNKYRGQRREARALWTEIRKAAALGPAKAKNRRKKPKAEDEDDTTDIDYQRFMHREWGKQDWLVDRMWRKGAYGIFAGEYKAYKTTVLLDLMLSVASGKPFLGRFPVSPDSVGKVCYVFEEGRPQSIQDRTRRLANRKGLWGSVTPNGKEPGKTEITFDRNLPIRFWTHPRLNLADPTSQEKLSRYVAQQKPKLLILETFYLLASGIDENAQAEVAPILAYLARLSLEHQTSLILSHHFHKPRDIESAHKRLLDRVSGTGVFGRWYDSALFSERVGDDEDNTIRLTSAHRDGQGTHMELTITWNPKDETDMEIVQHETEEKGKVGDLLELLKTTNSMTVQHAANSLGVTRQTITNWADKSRRLSSRMETVGGQRQRIVFLA